MCFVLFIARAAPARVLPRIQIRERCLSSTQGTQPQWRGNAFNQRWPRCCKKCHASRTLLHMAAACFGSRGCMLQVQHLKQC